MTRVVRKQADIRITLNGESRTVPAGPLSALLKVLKVPAGRVAVIVNGRVVRKALFTDTLLCEGDILDMVTLAGGG